MASSSSTGTISEEETRWVVIGVCLNKVIAPALRKDLKSKLQKWYIDLCRPPDDINKQDIRKYMKTLPPSKFPPNYKSINNNEKKSRGAYDFAVKDSLSLAKLFLQPNMAKFTGFDETMDMSAILGVMCNAKPFSSAATIAETVRNDIRNKWAHCNFSEWTRSEFTASIQNLKSLINIINLAPADAKALCDGLDDWEKKSLQWCLEETVNSELLKLVTEEVAELRKSVETRDTKMSEVLDNFDKKLRDMLCRTEKLEELAAENSKGIKRNSEGVERNSQGVERNSQGVERNSEELQRQSEKLEVRDKKRRTEDHGFQQFSKNKVPYGMRSLPRDMVERPSEVNEILGLLKPGNSKVGVVGSRSGDVFGIRGMGGLGKTVLALAVAWAASDSRQVIWLDIGETPDCLALINILIKVLGGAVSFSDIDAAQAWIKANTGDKDCLVILDDVWSVDDVAVFDHLSGKCQLLITTRDAKVVHGSKGFVYELQFMAVDKSRALLYQSAGVVPDELSTFSPEMHQIVEELLNQCRGLPLALSLVGSNLIDTRLQQDWEDVLGYFQNADLELLHSQFPNVTYPYDNILAAIDASFQRLEKSKREKFLDFGIFPEDINIASDILELFWSSKEAGRTSYSPQEGRCILKALERKSLIQKGPELQGKTNYRVHDLLLDFARKKLQASGTLTDVQRVFVKTLRGQCVNGEWTTTSSTSQKDYYFKYLPYHLHSSEQHSELVQIFFHFDWLEQKVKQTNVPSLISDFRFLDTPLQHEIKLLKKSLMLSADAIEKNMSSIGPQLLGRLLSYASDECPSVKKLLEDVRETSRKTFHLLPLFSCLKLEGAEIFKKNVGSAVRSLATSNSSTGTIVISGLENGSIHIHELETGKELQVLEGHTNTVWCLALSHSQRHLASGSRDNTARLWDVVTFEQLNVLQVEGGDVAALDFSTDDQRLFTGSQDGKLRVWRVTTGELLDVIPAHDDPITSLCTTKDGLYIATASRDHTIKLWRADTLNFEATLVGHTDVVRSVVAAGNDNPILASASWDGTLKIWDAKKHVEIHTLRGHEGQIHSVAVSSDTKRIISGGRDMIMRLWCFHTGELLSCFEGHSSTIRSVSITSDGFKALSGSADDSFRVWDLDTSAHLKQDRSRGHSKSVIDIAVTHDGSRCVSASLDDTFKVWKCESAEEGCFTLRDPKGYPVNVAISADDRHVVSLSSNFLSSSIKVWDLLDGNEITGIELDNKAVLVRFCTDGRLVIIGCEDERVVIWDWLNYDKKRVVTLPSPFTTFAEIACEGNIIYTCSRNMKVCQIDLGSLEVSAVRQGPYPNCTPVVVLPDGKTVLSGSLEYSGFAEWELSPNERFVYGAGHSDDSIVTAIDITSNGKLALTGSSSGTLSLMNLTSYQVVETFTTTEAGVGVRLVCILSDETRFVFVDQANRVELRDFNNKEAELLLDQPAVKVTCITTLGVDYVLLGCENGELLLFNLNVKQYMYEHQAHSEAVSQVKSDAASLLRFVSGSASGCVKLWYVSKTRESGSTSQNINGGAKFTPLWSLVWSHDNVYPHPITALTFVPDSKDIVIGSFYGNKVHRINAAGVVRTYEFDGHRIAALRVVEDSLIAVGLSHDDVKVIKWSLNEGLVIEEFDGNLGKQYYDILRVNNASNHVASIDCNSLLIWNLKCGTMLHRVDITHDIRALSLVPGGEFLLSSSWRDKTLKLWNLRSGRFVEEYHFDQSVEAIACSSNGMVCVGLRDGQVCFLRFNNLSSHSGQLEQ